MAGIDDLNSLIGKFPPSNDVSLRNIKPAPNPGTVDPFAVPANPPGGSMGGKPAGNPAGGTGSGGAGGSGTGGQGGTSGSNP